MRRSAGLAVLALLATGIAVGEALTPSTEHVLLVGDSIMRQSGPAVARQLGDGYSVHNEGVNGSGLLTPGVFDWIDQLEVDLVRTDPDVVVVLFIGNYTDDADQLWTTAQGRPVRDNGSAAFSREWGRQAERVVATIVDSGAEVVLVLPPPMPNEELQAVADALRGEYQRVARRWPEVTVVDATEAVGGPGGEWVAELPTRGGDVLPVRIFDGVHLAAHGQRLVARQIVGAIRG